MPSGLNAVQKFLGPSGATSRSAILVPKTCLRSTQNDAKVFGTKNCLHLSSILG